MKKMNENAKDAMELAGLVMAIQPVEGTIIAALEAQKKAAALIQSSFEAWRNAELSGEVLVNQLSDLARDIWMGAKGRQECLEADADMRREARDLLASRSADKTVPLEMLRDARAWKIDPEQFDGQWQEIAARYGYTVTESAKT